MKKGLICACALLGAAATASALPAAPKIYENLLINRVSPDGRYASSDMYGILTIFDLETDQVYVYAPEDEVGQENYTSGLGNCWSANGILVGTNSYQGTPTYWQDGKWHELPNPGGRGVWVQGINKAGTVVCATVDVLPTDNLEEGLLNIPMVWAKGEDGKWGDPVILPYPTRDFTNRLPQMATALVVSDDGKKIAGQVRDYFGAFPMPILYEQDAAGKWSYRLLAENLFNTKGRVFPNFMDNAPVSPEMQDFISDPATKAAWEAAYQNWVESGYATKYPDPVDYMSQEDAIRYNEAKKAGISD